MMTETIDMSARYGTDARAAAELKLYAESTQALARVHEDIRRDGVELLRRKADRVAVRAVLARRFRHCAVTAARGYRREVIPGAYFGPEVIRLFGDALAADFLDDVDAGYLEV